MPLQQFERAPSPSKAQFNEQATMLSNTQQSLTYVVDGKQCANNIPVGAYFQLINSTVTGRSDGAYTAKMAIPANTDIDNTYFTETAPITGGAVNSAFQALNSKLTSESTWTEVIPNSSVCFATIHNGIIFVRGHSFGETTIGGGSGYVALATLPERYRPRETLYFPVGWSGSGMNMQIGIDGVISFAGDAQTYWNYFVSYPF